MLRTGGSSHGLKAVQEQEQAATRKYQHPPRLQILSTFLQQASPGYDIVRNTGTEKRQSGLGQDRSGHVIKKDQDQQGSEIR